ncbi:zinc finger, CCHC-type containing protein [Tanacetum coccineum]|uniref:Zinc finger, CCHC-type containing protein n=1 Tax=Tanacetum coccineum TaxID=301880 RepID=A0ABQ5BUM3_9ASTR
MSLICERHANNLQDPEVSTTSELFALANGPSRTPMSVNACVVDGVRYVVQSRDERRTTQNSGICAPGPDGEMSYGQLQEILEFKYLSFKVALFRVKWFDTRNNGRVKKLTFRNGMTQIIGSGEWWKNDQYILATQVKQVFYLEDPAKPNVKVVEHVNHKKFFNRGVIVVENEPDIIHLDNSSDLPPSTSGNDLDNVTFYIDLHIDGESTEVDAPPDIIDVPGEDDDISDDEDPLPHDLADSDVEDLINDDDGMADVARAHGRDGGGEDPSRPPPPSFGCAGCFINRGKGKRKPNLGGVKAGRKTRERTRNQVLKDAVAANKGRPIEIGFEDRADNTVVPTGPYSTQWGNYFGEMIRSIPLYYPSWQKVPAGDKARLMATLGSTYNLEPHMRSERWPRIEGYIQAQFGKSYNTNKATLKREHWIRDPETGAYDLDRIRRGKPDEYTDDEWEKYINFWNDPANAQRAETNRLNRSKSTVVSRHGSRSIPLTRHLMKMTSATQEEPSEIDTFYRLHTVNGVFQDPEALRMYDRMRELEATGEHTTAEINAMVRGGKLRGHIPGVGPVMPGYVRSRLSYSAPVDRSNDVDFMMSLMRSDDRFADAFARYDSGGASGSGGSRARDSEGGEDGDDTGREDGGDDTIVHIKKICRLFPSDMSLRKGDSKRQNSHGASVDKSTNIKVTPSDMSLRKLPLKDKTVESEVPSNMSLGNLVPPWHQFLDKKIRGAHFSLGIVAENVLSSSLPHQCFPSDMLLGIGFPNDMSLAKVSECCWGKG